MHVSRHNGGYRVIVQHKGRRRSVVVQTWAEVQEANARLVVELGGKLESSTITVSGLLVEWTARKQHAPTYAADVARIIRRLPAHFTDRTLENVDPAVTAHLYDWMVADGWSAHRIRRAREVLSSAWRLAEQNRWATYNPISAADAPTRLPRQVQPPTPPQVAQLLAATQGTALGLFLALSATTGARRGEMVALQWQDITGSTIVIRRSLTWTPESGLDIRDTKTGVKGHRVIAISPLLTERLSALKLDQAQKAMASGMGRPTWVFSHTAGKTPWLPNYSTHEFVALRKRLGITGVRLGDLRHFAATQLLAAGEAATTVAHRLGHSTTSTTLRTYAHFVQATDQHAAETMDRVLGLS